METLKIKKLRENAVIPKRATQGSAGMDLPHECVKIPTGIAVALPSALYGAFIFARSGLSIKHGVAPANCVGVVDSDYRGEVIVGLVNQYNEPYTIEPQERVAQMVIMPVSLMPVEECDVLDETERDAGGFGSTGKK